MKLYLALAVFLASAVSSQPSPAQGPLPVPPVLANDTCAGCFAYLVFAPSMEPESYATRGQATEYPAADELSDRLRQFAGGNPPPSSSQPQTWIAP